MSFIQTSNGCKAPDKNNPGTHLFIIGVGEYTAFRNRLNSNLPLFRHSLDPPKLPSATQSALHMADWFIAHYNNPVAPLRSVEMVISPKQPDYTIPEDNQSPAPVEEATIRNIQSGFIQWYQRCDAREDNIAVFYFAGHGLYCATQLLLAQDFLENYADPLEAAIDYDLTFHEMARCQAKHQIFFIDACRVAHSQITKAVMNSNWHVSNAKTLSHPKANNAMNSRNALQVFATQINETAYGYTPAAPGQIGPSRFAQTLKEHLTGRGATENNMGDWHINHRDLGHYLWRSMVRDNTLSYSQQPQVPEAVIHCPKGESILHKLTSAPIIPVRLGCLPALANPEAHFILRDKTSGSFIDESTGSRHGKEPWSLQLRADDYTVEVDFSHSGGGYPSQPPTPVWAATPFTDFDMKVR
jgi:hypothetical protein